MSCGHKMEDTPKYCGALLTRLVALEKMLDEREERTKERFAAMDRSVCAALASSDKAISKAETATEKRFDGVNEFRDTLRDQAATLLSRSEYLIQHKALEARFTQIEDKVSTIENRTIGKKEGLSFVGQIVLGAIALGATSAAFITAFSRMVH